MDDESTIIRTLFNKNILNEETNNIDLQEPNLILTKYNFIRNHLFDSTSLLEHFDIAEFNPVDYQILEKLGQGAFGQVFKAWHVPSATFCALKIVKVCTSEQDANQVATLMEDLIKERDILELLNTPTTHDNIITFHKLFGEVNIAYNSVDKLILQMESGICSLQELISTRKYMKKDAKFIYQSTKYPFPYPEQDILYILYQISQGLLQCKKKSVVNFDIKPSNIIFTNKGNTFKVGDFGVGNIFSFAEGQSQQASISEIAGTPLYMSFEIKEMMDSSINDKGETKVDPFKCDIFSLGITVLILMGVDEQLIKKYKSGQIEIRQLNYSSAYEELIPLIEAMLKKDNRERICIEELVEILTKLANKNHRFDEAETIKIIEHQRNVEERPLTSQMDYYTELMEGYRQIGIFQKVREYTYKLLEIWEKLPSEESSRWDLENLYIDIGIAEKDLSHYETSLDFFRKALEIQSSKPNNKFGIAQTYYQIASIHHQLSHFKESLRNFEAALDLFEAVGEFTWKASCIRATGYLHQTLGNYDKAFECYSQTLELLKTLHISEDSAMMAHTISLMGDIYYKMSNYKLALENYESALEAKRKIYRTEEHKTMIKLFLNKGLVHQELGDYEMALENFEKSLRIQLKIYGTEEHIQVATTINNIAILYSAKGNVESALEFYEKCLAILKNIFHNDDQMKIAECINNIGSLYYQVGEIDKALEHFEKSLEIQERIHNGIENDDIAILRNNMGAMYCIKKNYDKALEQYEKALRLWRNLFKSDKHLNIATILNNIGVIHREQGDLDKALLYLKDAAVIEIDIFGTENHITVAETFKSISKIYKGNGDLEKCTEYLEKAMLIFQEEMQRSSCHKSLSDIFQELETVYKERGLNEESQIMLEKRSAIDLSILNMNLLQLDSLGLTKNATSIIVSEVDASKTE